MLQARKILMKDSPVPCLEMINAGGLIKGDQLKAMRDEWTHMMGSKGSSAGHGPVTAQWESGSTVASLGNGLATSSLGSTVKDLFGERAHRASLAASAATSRL